MLWSWTKPLQTVLIEHFNITFQIPSVWTNTDEKFKFSSTLSLKDKIKQILTVLINITQI